MTKPSVLIDKEGCVQRIGGKYSEEEFRAGD
jgi:hypothetical protein